jgi:hypothetical protein
MFFQTNEEMKLRSTKKISLDAANIVLHTEIHANATYMEANSAITGWMYRVIFKTLYAHIVKVMVFFIRWLNAQPTDFEKKCLSRIDFSKLIFCV